MAEKGAEPGEHARRRARSARRSARRRCPSAHRAAASARQAPCCRCAAHWWRRYCRSRCRAHRRGRRAWSGAGRRGSSRADSRGQARGDRQRLAIGREHRRSDLRNEQTPNCSLRQRSCRRGVRQRGSAAPGLAAAPASKGVFLDRERRRSGSTTKGVSRSMSTRSAGAPLARRPLGKPEQARRIRGQRPQQRGKLDARRCDRGGARRRAASRAPMAPSAASAKGRRLPSASCGIVGRDDHVDIAAGDALDHGAAVVLGAERRPHLEEGAVGADVVLVQREVVDRDAAGDGQAASPWRRG